MLLIDGVKYELWTPQKEVEEFHPLVREHCKEIFGEDSLFFEASILKSEAGRGSLPDGFVITLNGEPQWHIVEMELSSHQLYDHIVNQVGRFITGVKNAVTETKTIEAIYQHVQGSKQRRAVLEEKIGSGEIFRFVSELVKKPPVLVVIIEKKTPELDEALGLLKYSPIRVVEFKTFKRVGAETVHAHLFEPLYVGNKVKLPSSPSPPPPPPPTPGEEIEIKLHKDSIRACYIDIRRAKKDQFPAFKTTLELETDIGLMKPGFNPAHWGTRIQGGLPSWFKAHPELRIGDKVRIIILEPMKKYRLEIVK